MGKVTIIVESDNVPTNRLYKLMQIIMTSEKSIKRNLGAIDGMAPDVRVYIVPSDD